MHLSSRLLSVVGLGLVCFVVLDTRCEAQPPSTLKLFRSEEGKFTIEFPGIPQHQETNVGKKPEEQTIQHQYVIPGENGIYLVSYQDNPNLITASKEKIEEALTLGIGSLITSFGGKQLDLKDIMLSNKHPGKELRVSIPAAKGEAKCRLYLVGPRLYQVMAVGIPEFVTSDQSTEVLDSFGLIDS